MPRKKLVGATLVEEISSGKVIRQKFKVPSRSSRRVYIVTRVGKKWSCTDPGWINREGPKQDCPHIEGIKKQLDQQ